MANDIQLVSSLAQLAPVLWVLLAYFLSIVGFLILALSQRRYFTQIIGEFGFAARTLWLQRGVGLLAIASALPACILATSAGFGSLLWPLIVMTSAAFVVQLLTWFPKSLSGLRHFYRSKNWRR